MHIKQSAQKVYIVNKGGDYVCHLKSILTDRPGAELIPPYIADRDENPKR